MVGCDGSNGIDDPSVVTQTVNFLPGAVDTEFAVVFDQRGCSKVQGAKAVLNNVDLKNGSSFTEKRLSQTFTVGQIGGRKSLKSFSVTNGDEIRFADIRNDGNVGGKVEVNRKRDEFIQGKKIFGFDERYVKNEDYRLLLRAVK